MGVKIEPDEDIESEVVLTRYPHVLECKEMTMADETLFSFCSRS